MVGRPMRPGAPAQPCRGDRAGRFDPAVDDASRAVPARDPQGRPACKGSIHTGQSAWGLDGEELKPAEIGRREGMTVRAVSVRLGELQTALRTASVQLVLLAVPRVMVPPRPRRKRRRRVVDWVQMVLGVA
jgi:hypothetical protein